MGRLSSCLCSALLLSTAFVGTAPPALAMPPPRADGLFLPATPLETTWADSTLQPSLTDPDGASHRFPWGQCTWYVGTRRKITFRGNAREWPTNAARAGYRVSGTPVVGAVAVTHEGRYGHVAYVEEIHGSTITISESNYHGLGRIDRRDIPITKVVKFIL